MRIPRSPTGRRYLPIGAGRTGGTRVNPALCGSAWVLCPLVLPRGLPILQAPQVGLYRLGCIRLCVGVDSLCVSWCSQGASLCPKRLRQRWRELGASVAVWNLVGPVSPHTPTARPYPPGSLGRTVETQVHLPLFGSGGDLCLLVLSWGVPMPQAARAGLEDFRCIHRCAGADVSDVSLYSHGPHLSPKQPGQDRRD